MLHQKHESYKYVLPPKNWVEWITTRHEKHFTTSKMYILRSAGLSMNILHAGNKSLVQRCFFKNSTGNLLHALMEVTMHHMHSTYHQWYVEQQHILEIQKWQKTCSWNSKSPKTKKYTTNYTRYTMLKKLFLMIYVGTYDCYENIKTKIRSTISILKPWH